MQRKLLLGFMGISLLASRGLWGAGLDPLGLILTNNDVQAFSTYITQWLQDNPGKTISDLNYTGMPILKLVAGHHSPEMLELLFMRGADPAYVDAQGYNLWHLVVVYAREDRHRSAAMIKKLITQKVPGINNRTNDGYIPLAISSITPEIFRLLVEEGGADITIPAIMVSIPDLYIYNQSYGPVERARNRELLKLYNKYLDQEEKEKKGS